MQLGESSLPAFVSGVAADLLGGDLAHEVPGSQADDEEHDACAAQATDGEGIAGQPV